PQIGIPLKSRVVTGADLGTMPLDHRIDNVLGQSGEHLHVLGNDADGVFSLDPKPSGTRQALAEATAGGPSSKALGGRPVDADGLAASPRIHALKPFATGTARGLKALAPESLDVLADGLKPA